jgi:hypothetical protein
MVWRIAVVNKKPVTIRVGAETFILDAPGLDPRRRQNGLALYWVAPEIARKRGFTPASVRMHYDVRTAEGRDALAARCRALWAEARDWLGDPARQSQLVYDGTVASLIKIYQKHENSPYRALRPNTRKGYDDWCTRLERYAGARRIDRLDGTDLRRWFGDFVAPSKPGAAPRIRQARGIVQQMFPILLAFGVELKLPDCLALLTVIQHMEFRVSPAVREQAIAMKPKRSAMTYEHAAAIVRAGIGKGTKRHRSVALGTAAQFEFTLSQIDVIGSWEPIEHGAVIEPGQIVRSRQIWRPGLRYEDLAGGTLEINRSKTFVGAVFDVKEYPLFAEAMQAVPDDERSGPLVVNESGLPMARYTYADLFRELADEAKVPREVFSMTARHGGASEARASGVPLEDTSEHLQHSNIATTKKHYVQPSIETTRRVARARVASRKKGAA